MSNRVKNILILLAMSITFIAFVFGLSLLVLSGCEPEEECTDNEFQCWNNTLEQCFGGYWTTAFHCDESPGWVCCNVNGVADCASAENCDEVSK